MHPVMPYILSSSDDMLIKLWDWEKVSYGTCSLSHGCHVACRHWDQLTCVAVPDIRKAELVGVILSPAFIRVDSQLNRRAICCFQGPICVSFQTYQVHVDWAAIVRWFAMV